MVNSSGAINSPAVILNTSNATGANVGLNNPINIVTTGSVSLTLNVSTSGSASVISGSSSLTIANPTAETNLNINLYNAGSIIDPVGVATTGHTTLSTNGGNISFTGTKNPGGVDIDLEAPGGTVTFSTTATNLTAIANEGGNGNGGSITVNAGSIVLNPNAGTVFDASSVLGSGGKITLATVNGGLDIGTGVGQLSLNAPSGGGVGGSVSVTVSGGTLTVDPSAISVGGAILDRNNTISLSGESIAQSGTAAITSANIILAATFGDIGASANPILTASLATNVVSNLTATATGNVYVNNTGTVTLIGTSSAGSASTFMLTNTVDSNGNGAINIASGGKIIAGTVQLQSNESVTGSGGITQIGNSQTVSVNAPTISLADGNGAGGVGSGNITVSTSQGSNPLSFNVSTTGNVSLTTSGLTTATTDVLSGANVSVSGLTGSNLTINNQGMIQASGFLNISNKPDATDAGGGVIISGGGTMSAVGPAGISISAQMSADSLSSNVVEFPEVRLSIIPF